jgi:hypothetical protein
MTHPHLLTDDTCFGIALETESRIGYQPPSIFDYMRAAYDKGRADMLEQVIEWLQANLWLCDDNLGPLYIKEDCLSDKVIDEKMVIDDLKKAMRPQKES